ncbi:MAG: GTP-binding protein [Anaerolineae bacterium]|nr:GTP-binding protein [Anaerolineae bacterium]
MSLLLLPKQIQDMRKVLDALNWRELEKDIARETQARLVIVGPVNSGKSTLFNYFHNHRFSAVSAVPGTTKGVVEQPFGPFLLVDTPGFGEVWGVDRADIANAAAASADLILLLLDAAAGVRQSDHDLYHALCALGIPVVVAANKTDLVKPDLPWILENIESLLGVRPIPVSARTGKGIADKLLPAILEAQPTVAVAMARALPGVRKQLVNQIILRTSWLNAMISLEPFPGLDVPLLLASQTRMVLRIGAAYGQSMSVSHARELLTTMAGSLLSRYLGGQLAKFIPGPGWVISGVISAVSTWGIGQAAQHYFEAGGKLKGPDLRVFYQRMRKLAPQHLFRRRKEEAVDGEEAGSKMQEAGDGTQDVMIDAEA